MLDQLCTVCGIGYSLPSGLCDHCDQPVDGKPKADKLDRIITLLEEIKNRLTARPIMAPQMQTLSTPFYPTRNPGNVPNSPGLQWGGINYPQPEDVGPRCPECGLVMNKLSERVSECGWPGCSAYKLPNFNQPKPE